MLSSVGSNSYFLQKPRHRKYLDLENDLTVSAGRHIVKIEFIQLYTCVSMSTVHLGNIG